jgi:hypothetical protein
MKILQQISGLNEPNDFETFLLLVDSSCDELLKTVTPMISKRNTNMQEAIIPSQHLSIILCYLATGNTLEYLKSVSAVSQYIRITADRW